MAKSGAQTLTFNSVTNKQTNQQTDKKLNVFGRLGTLVEDLMHILAPRKLLGVRRIVSPLGGAENLGET